MLNKSGHVRCWFNKEEVNILDTFHSTVSTVESSSSYFSWTLASVFDLATFHWLWDMFALFLSLFPDQAVTLKE